MNEKLPVPASLYDADYYKNFNHGYESFAKDSELMPDMKRKLDLQDFKGKSVLDLGCGRGEALVYCVKHGAVRAVGIDYSSAAIDITKEFVSRFESKDKIEAYVMDVKELKFPDSSFDFVILMDIVEHLQEWELKKCYVEVRRVLKPGGQIIIHTSPNKMLFDIVRIFTTLFGVKLKSSPYHVNEQTYFSIKNDTKGIFEGEISLEKDVHYWYNQMGMRGTFLKKFGKFADLFFDSYVIHNLFSWFPLSIIFCTDIWFTARKTG